MKQNKTPPDFFKYFQLLLILLFLLFSGINSAQIKNINFILDASGSMEGYLNGNNFRAQIGRILGQLNSIMQAKEKFKVDALNCFTTNAKALPEKYNGLPYDFINAVLNNSIAVQNSTPLDNLFNHISVELSKNSNDLYVIATDLIIDSAPNQLVNVKTRFQFLGTNLKQMKMAVSIFRFLSDYSGTYISNFTGASHKVNNIQRPYYVCFVGKAEFVRKIIHMLYKAGSLSAQNEINLGFNKESPKYELFPAANNKAKFSLKGVELNNISTEVYEAKIFLGLKLHQYSGEITDLNYLNTNLRISTNTTKFFRHPVITFSKIKGQIPTSYLKVAESYSHFLPIDITAFTQNDEMTISLVENLPQWITDFNIVNDGTLNSSTASKTYALEYIIQGLAYGYNEFIAAKNILKVIITLND